MASPGWGRSLIVRVLQGRVHPEQIAVFREQAQQALDEARQQDGLIHAEVGRQIHQDGGEQVIFVSVWRDLDALYRWIGGTDLLDTPVLNGGTADLFQHFEVQHYESCEATDLTPGAFQELRAAAPTDAVG
jgi:quinol monooxygenase YgiN